MQVKLQYTEETQQALEQAVAKAHADAVLQYLQENFEEQEAIAILKLMLDQSGR